MVTQEQIKGGINAYVNNEIIAKMQISPNSIKRGLIVTGINLWLTHNVNAMLGASSGAASLGIVDENGHYDIDKIVNEFKKTIPERGYNIDLSISGFKLGSITIYGEDIDRLVDYVERA